MSKEIHLCERLAENRRRCGITQEELARFMGVSKAAVSKWETGAAYPDILLLPSLASYFDMSIDELMGYEPQMSTEQIRDLYHKLAKEFTARPFGEVLDHLREYIKKYYACYPFLFEAAVLLVNHCTLAEDQKRTLEVVEEAQTLLRRVRSGTDDTNLARSSLQLEAYCMLILRRPEEVLDLLEEEPPDMGTPEQLLASAWQMLGNTGEAKRILQIAVYRNVIGLVNLQTSYLELCLDEPEKFKESCRRFHAVAEAFQIDRLHPGALLSSLIVMAQGWMALGRKEEALCALKEYTRLATGDIYPLHLKGDDYFDRLDEWFREGSRLADYPPRNELTIRRSMTQAVTENPAFAALADDPRFRAVAEQLRNNEKEERIQG